MRFSTNIKLPHKQEVKRILKYLKFTSEKVLIMNPNPEKGIQCYVDADFYGGCNQEEGKDPRSVISITGYVLVIPTVQSYGRSGS